MSLSFKENTLFLEEKYSFPIGKATFLEDNCGFPIGKATFLEESCRLPFFKKYSNTGRHTGGWYK
jgi:hypothetical protein